MVTGGSCGARPPSCSVVRVAPARRFGSVGAGPAAAALTVSPFLLWVGAPPRPWGGGGPRLWLPSWGGCGGGGGGGGHPACSRACVGGGGGGGVGGGPPVPWRCPLSVWGWWRGAPGGGACHRCEGRLASGAVPPPAARPLERAAGVLRPVCPGCGRCGRVDPAPAPQRAPLRAAVARCGGGGRASPGGVPSTVVRGAWCQALPLPRPLVLRSVQPGFRDPCVPGAVGAGVWTQHRPHSVRPCGLALLAVGLAEGRPRGGAFHRCEGRLVSGAVPLPAARPLERAARAPRPVCPGRG